MDQIIKDLKEHTLFNSRKLRGLIYILTIIYSIFILWIIFDTISGIGNLYDVDKVAGSISSIGIILYLLTFISLVSGGAKQIEINEREAKNNEEKILSIIKGGKYDREGIIKEFNKKYNKNFDTNLFSNLGGNDVKRISKLRLSKTKIGNTNEKDFNGGELKGWDIGPLIKYNDKGIYSLTKEGEKIFKELGLILKEQLD